MIEGSLSRRKMMSATGLAGLTALLASELPAAASTGQSELLDTWLLILRAPADLDLRSIPAYTSDGERILVHGYELAEMTEDERWQWANDWLATWPDGRQLLIDELVRLTSA